MESGHDWQWRVDGFQVLFFGSKHERLICHVYIVVQVLEHWCAVTAYTVKLKRVVCTVGVRVHGDIKDVSVHTPTVYTTRFGFYSVQTSTIYQGFT
jgi:hypothetical protein